MHRMRPDRTLEVIPVDVEGILSGNLPDVPMQANDVLFIPTKQEMMEDQTITIHGEVHYPGVYKYASNETIEDFIMQAGGLTDAASLVKVDVSRRVSNPHSTEAGDQIAQTFSFRLSSHECLIHPCYEFLVIKVMVIELLTEEELVCCS